MKKILILLIGIITLTGCVQEKIIYQEKRIYDTLRVEKFTSRTDTLRYVDSVFVEKRGDTIFLTKKIYSIVSKIDTIYKDKEKIVYVKEANNTTITKKSYKNIIYLGIFAGVIVLVGLFYFKKI